MTGGARTGSTGAARGLVAGAVLRAVRESIGRTQEALAEMLQVSPETVQSWETGRRALIGGSFADLQRLRRQLAAAGTDPGMLRLWDQALDADAILDGLDNTGATAAHPFAYLVPDRTLSQLVAWPITGAPPRQLGHVRTRLHSPAQVRDHLATRLRSAADQAGPDERAAMLRRQARFFVAAHPGSRQWVSDLDSAERNRMPDLREWSPAWPVARSRAVSAAVAGDTEPVEQFIREGLSTDKGIEANLQYWAYWVGEIPTRWNADSDMLTPQPYSGDLLLSSLIVGLETAPYRELCAHTIWSLLRCRPRLADQTDLTRRLAGAIDIVTSTAGLLSRDTLHRLDQVAYRIGR